MLNKIIAPQQTLFPNCFEIELDRIVVFVAKGSDIDALRELNLHYFEFAICNYQHGISSHIFFFENVNLELIAIEDCELATQYSAQTNINIISRIQWQQNRAFPFGLVFRYAANPQDQSRRRRDRSNSHRISHIQTSSKINFSLENLNKLEEPTCYIVPHFLTSERLLDSTSSVKQKLSSYYSKTNSITDIQITLDTSKSLSSTFALISDLNSIGIKRGSFPKLELKLNEHNSRRMIRLASVPLMLNY